MTSRLALVMIAAYVAGCSARSASIVTGETVVSIPRAANLVSNTSFANRAWRIVVPQGAKRTILAAGRKSILQISRPSRTGSGNLAVVEITDYLPTVRPGAEYALTLRLRALHVTSSLTTELRLNYVGGGYDIFDAFSGRTRKRAAATATVHGTTPGWVTMQVIGRARSRLTSIDVVALTLAPGGPFSGVVWISDPRLVLLKGGS